MYSFFLSFGDSGAPAPRLTSLISGCINAKTDDGQKGFSNAVNGWQMEG